MDRLVVALGPAFAAGFAVQRLLEILDSIVNWVIGRVAGQQEGSPQFKETKGLVLGLVSLMVGLGLSFGLQLRVLQPLGITDAGVIDNIATGLVISAGTEGINSIMKFLGYIKDNAYLNK